MVARLEDLVFRHRALILVLLGVFTLVMANYASQLRMDAGFTKQLPREHEYIDDQNPGKISYAVKKVEPFWPKFLMSKFFICLSSFASSS